MAKNPLEDLTLVVPTYFRQPYALRLMRYWNGKGPKVIVVDGTDKPIPRSDLDTLETSIIYVHNQVGIFERLRGVLDLITTKYVALAGDDEFYIPSALVRCIRELDDDSKLVACSGIAIGFCPEQNFVRGQVVYPKLLGYEVTESRARDRVLSHMSNYEVNQIYGVCRLREWRIVQQGITMKEFPVFAIGEYQFELSMSFAGKSKVIDELMWLRNCGETKPIRGTDPSLGNLRFLDWFRDKTFVKEHLELIDISARILCNLSSDCDYPTSRAIAKAGFDAFHKCLTAQQSFEWRLLNSTPLGLLWRVMPSLLKNIAKRLLNRRNNERFVTAKLEEVVHLSELAKKLERDFRIKVSFTELSEIEALFINNKTAIDNQA